jgi:hypothetical protein
MLSRAPRDASMSWRAAKKQKRQTRPSSPACVTQLLLFFVDAPMLRALRGAAAAPCTRAPWRSCSRRGVSGDATAALDVLVLAEHAAGGALRPVTLAALAAATQLRRAAGGGSGGGATVLVAGHAASARAAAEAASRAPGVRAVLLADSASLAHGLAEPTAALLVALQRRHVRGARETPAS